ncbi:MAG: malto-oligosyltrehalose synthase [Alphaproteobacteria bacterium]|nr:malto-oligosyltrehalose synthase [Alphaproteobacteria bacterium]
MIPRGTYRLQFHKGFPFSAALPLAPYFQQFGISHLYSSPILTARTGSMHGYDVVDHSTINAELGGEKGFRQLASELRSHGIGIILDIVPNHMAVDPANRWWMDVLEHGRRSAYAEHFDIDWDALNGKVLLALLGKPYWQAVEDGELRIARDHISGKSHVAYFDKRLPLRPEDQAIDPADAAAPAALHTLLEQQHYRLAWWRTANDIINWRRFFDVSDLIALKQDAAGVFEASHAKIFELYRSGLIDGLRIDHIDGLADPEGYCRRLRNELVRLAAERPRADPHPYIVIEKILGSGETLAADWGVDGTTGYDFMDEVSSLQHEPDGAEPLARLWHEVSGRPAEFEAEEIVARAGIIEGSFESALRHTVTAFQDLAALSKDGRDVTEASFRRSLILLLQCLRVYRMYAGAGASSPTRQLFGRAVRHACRLAGPGDQAAIAFIASTLDRVTPEGAEAVRRFNHLSAPVAAKAVEDTAFYRYGRLLSRNDVGFSPGTFSRSLAGFHEAMAERARHFPHALLSTATHDHKRGEDVRARLAVLSEIPHEWETATTTWKEMNYGRRPERLTPGDEYQLYQMLVGGWPLDLEARNGPCLSAFRDRVLGWQVKALREAKLCTSWLDPHEEYENQAQDFLRSILDPSISAEFLDSLRTFVHRVSAGGAMNGLVQATLRCTAPGVPDCYQGAEFWDFSLVDPDNRRPVDYGTRAAALKAEFPLKLLSHHWRDGRVKQALLAALLRLRRQYPGLFEEGGYHPVNVVGSQSDHVLAFERRSGSRSMIVAVALRCASACIDLPRPKDGFWENTEVVLPASVDGSLEDILCHSRHTEEGGLSCGKLFAWLPAAVLVSS